MSESTVKKLLITKFESKHVDAFLKHFSEAIEKFITQEWDEVAHKAGRFIEAVTKALMLHCGKTLPANMKHFKAGLELRALEQVSSTAYSDTVRTLVPRACIFSYDIVSNRGGRHDPNEIDANEMDAKVVLPIMQWILAELVRFASVGGDTDKASDLINELTNKIYPYFEKIEGRTYVNIDGLSAPDVALLLLYEKYPNKMARSILVDSIVRHGHKRSAASMAITRMGMIDEEKGDLLLRAQGRQKAEKLLQKLQSET